MASELSFLIELLLKHKLPNATKDLIAARIKDVEEVLSVARPVNNYVARPVSNNGTGVIQAPSTQAFLDRNPDLAAAAIPSAPMPVEVVAQTPATMAALASRQSAIMEAVTGNREKGRTSPRKF